MLDKLPSDAVEVIMNIGSNRDPTLPVARSPPIIAIAFEPIVPHLARLTYPNASNLYIIPAAVSATDGLEMMAVLGRSSHYAGSASSLSAPADKKSTAAIVNMRAVAKAGGHRAMVVPVLGMRTVLNALPQTLALSFLKTDMQGHDFAALQSAGKELLHRAEFIKAETYHSEGSTYVGVRNSFCTNLLPHMDAIGFELVGITGMGAPGIFFDAPASRRHCKSKPERWPGMTDRGFEADAYFASPRRMRARPPVQWSEWPWPDLDVSRARS